MSLELPTLYLRDAAGKMLQWCVTTEGRYVVMTHGKVGGKQKVIKTPYEGTNAGRANARSAEQQALFAAKSAWESKKDEGYDEDLEVAKTKIVYLPALALPLITRRKKGQEIIEKRRDIFLPCFAQRKLNGLRALARIVDPSTVEFTSRIGVHWNLPHIANALLEIGRPGDWFDGEIYIHGLALQELNSLVKDYRQESITLGYHMYDMPQAIGGGSAKWEDRWLELTARYTLWAQDSNAAVLGVHPLYLVETALVETQEEVEAFEKLAIDGGFEGLILRKPGHEYAWNVRCENMIKWKRFTDEEFLVIDGKPRVVVDVVKDPVTGAETNVERTILDKFVCMNNWTDAQFEVVPRGSMALRATYWTDLNDYIGRQLTVRFLERSVDGIPQGNPVGVLFRDEADLAQQDDMAMWKNE